MYNIAQPSQALSEFVDSYWSHFTEPDRLSDLKIDVFVDGQADLVINLGCSYSRRGIESGGVLSTREIDFSNVDFQRTHPIQIIQQGMIAVCGMRFKPGGLGAFFASSLDTYTNAVVAPSELFGAGFHGLEKTLSESERTMAEIGRHLDSFLLEHLKQPRSFRTFWALKSEIEQGRGTRKVNSICDEVGVSARTAERLFKKYMGLLPKLYARIVRFQAVMKILMDEGRHNLADVAARFDYTDQAHLVKDFKDFAGGIPSRFKGYFPEGLPKDFAPNVVAFLQD